MSSQAKETVQPLYDRLCPRANEHLMVFAWQVGQFNGNTIKDWDAVIHGMKEEGWDYSDAHIKHQWYDVIVPAIVQSRIAAANYAKKERTNSNQGNNTFESVVDHTFNLEDDEEEYNHSLTPYARTILEKLAEEQEDASMSHQTATRMETEQEPGSEAQLPLLQPNVYVPPDSEKPFTRGYIGLNSKPSIDTATAEVEVNACAKATGLAKEANAIATSMPKADAHASDAATIADHDNIKASSSDTTSMYESLSETSSLLDMPSEVFEKYVISFRGQHTITANNTATAATQAAEKIVSYHGDYSDSDLLMDKGKRVIKAKADMAFIKHNKASEEQGLSKSTAKRLSNFATSDTRSCVADALQGHAIVNGADTLATNFPTADPADTGSNVALPGGAGELCSSMDEEYDPEDEASASEFS
ncbi:hypothetical protein SLS62_003585 [Diatrype stigma]|uniref:Uncharacterized protein n=1 Tax=Diatrype stigma TaxID=117547 RepID=A0AAN9YUA1_9PEZI